MSYGPSAASNSDFSSIARHVPETDSADRASHIAAEREPARINGAGQEVSPSEAPGYRPTAPYDSAKLKRDAYGMARPR
jgi:hypothetical protein